MAETTSLLQSSLFRIDPTEGLVQYVNDVKPYHSKVLDVLVEYVYEEHITATVSERWSWNMNLTQHATNTVYACGYGFVWGGMSLSDANPVVIIDEVVPSSYEISAVIPTNGATPGQIVTVGNVTAQFPVGSTFSLMGSAYSNSALTIPPNIIEFTVDAGGVTYTNGATYIPVEETLLTPSVTDDVNGRLYAHTNTPNSVANSFLVTPQSAPYDFSFVLSNATANQFTIVDRVAVVGVVVGSQRWILDADRVDDLVIGEKIYITSNTGNANSAYTVQSVLLNGATTEVTVAEPIFFGATPTGYANIPIPLQNEYTIVGVTPALRQWVIQGNHSRGILPNQNFWIKDNTGGSNGMFQVQAVAETGNTTVVTIKGAIPPLSTTDGVMEIGRLPGWVSGTSVSLSGTGALPPPLNSVDTYHFIPTSNPGVFNIASKRYPQEIADYVNVVGIGSGEMLVRRNGLYYPGATVQVSGTHNSLNNGTYFVKELKQEGISTRVYPIQRILYPHSGNNSVVGTMSLKLSGYDESYCPLASAGILYTHTYIDEHLQFTISMSPTDHILSVVEENNISSGGFGVSYYSAQNLGPYGDIIASDSMAVRSSVTGGLTLMPHGFDAQLWDIGGMGENIADVQNLYDRTLQ